MSALRPSARRTSWSTCSFQGTPRRPNAADIDSEIEAKGGWTNAWTSLGVDQLPGRSAKLTSTDLAIDLIADQMVNSLFAADKLDKERKVVLEELNGRPQQPVQQVDRPLFDRRVRRSPGPPPPDRQPRHDQPLHP